MTTTTYELIATPAERGFDCIIYKSIRGGVCGPFTDVHNLLSLEEAVDFFSSPGFGFYKIGNWTNFGGSLKAEVSK